MYFFFFSPKVDDVEARPDASTTRQVAERVGWTPNDRSWFSTLELPHTTALQVEEEKAKKYITQLEQLPSGNWIVKYRGLTKEEKFKQKEQQRNSKP